MRACIRRLIPSSPCQSDEHPVPPRHSQPVRGNGLKTMSSRPRYFLTGGIALVATAGLIGWLFLDQRGEVLKPGGGPVLSLTYATGLRSQTAARG